MSLGLYVRRRSRRTVTPLNVWQRWLREPQTLLLRRALFQVHLWTGVAVGLYVAMISLTGSILVYRNELYRAFSPEPRLVQDPGVRAAARRISSRLCSAPFRTRQIVVVEPGPTPNHAADVTLERDGRADAAARSPGDRRRSRDRRCHSATG